MRLAPKIFRIAARSSDLARLQAYRVGEALRAQYPDAKVEYAFRASLGDLNLNEPLWKMPEKGVFTEDFVRDLTEGTADLVVHSWKDLPTEQRPDTEIVATLPRADVRDLFLMRTDRVPSATSRKQLKVLTSSPRRAYNLSEFFKSYLPFEVSDVQFESVRGNIPTRLQKLIAQDVDALIVAKAALDRLLSAPEEEFVPVRDVIRSVLAKTQVMVLPLGLNPTAAAQGALAIEISKNRSDLREALQAIHCPETARAVEKERRILASYGGGCHQKIGVNVLRRPYGEVMYLRGLTDAGEVLNQVAFEAARSDERPKVEKARDAKAIFPREGEEATFFERETLPETSWSWVKEAPALWVARETAWPEIADSKWHQGKWIWTAGLATWKKLASRGVWVHGSSEGLGEQEDSSLEVLAGCEDLEWVKLTHDGSNDTESSRMKTCATYKLKPRHSAPDLKGRTHFYWMSASSFDRALELYPDLRDKHHASGPGLTHSHLKRVLGPRASVSVYLSVDAFRKAVQSS